MFGSKIPLSVYLDSIVGHGDAGTTEAEWAFGQTAPGDVYVCLRSSRFPLWGAVCAGAGSDVWPQLEGNHRLDHGGTTL